MKEDEIEEILEQGKEQSEALKSLLDKLEKSNVVSNSNFGIDDSSNIKPASKVKDLKRLFKRLFVITGMLFFTLTSFAQDNEGFVPRKIRVKLNRQVEVEVVGVLKARVSSYGDIIETGNYQLDALNSKFKVTKMKRVFPYAGKHESKHIKHGLHLWYELEVDNEADLKKVSERYSSTAAVVSAEPIHIKTLGDYLMVDAGVASAEPNALPLNDPYLSDQWHYNNDGSISNSIPGSDINLFEAWEIVKGSSDVVVAVVDGGIDVDHEDLAANMWVNEAEFNGEPGVDDDNNGFIDDVNGFNFIENSGNITAHDHGTHVAGTVSAVNNNGVGGAGVAGGSGNNDGVKLVSCQIFDNENGQANFANAIAYGADIGANISQNSWSYTQVGVYEQAVLDAIDYFVAEAGNYEGSKMKGGIVIFAAGNASTEAESYPAYYPGTVSVASIGPNFVKAPYSNYGTWVDITAPGGNLGMGFKHGVLSTTSNNNYQLMQGTSMACPHVSGIAALVISEFGGNAFTSEELKSRILTGVVDIESHNNEIYIGKLGSGLIDAKRTLEVNAGSPPNKINNLAIRGISKDFVVLSWDVPVDDDDETPIAYSVHWSENEITQENISSALSSFVSNDEKLVGDEVMHEIEGLKGLTNYYFTVVAIDRWGNRSEMSNVVNETTNEGPGISSDKDNLIVGVDASNSAYGTESFNILNTKTGYLRWDAEVRDVSRLYSTQSLEYPALQTIVTNSDASVSMFEQNIAEIASASPAEWEASQKQYYPPGTSPYFIGENDTTVANSMATRFYVTEEEGFNLTTVAALMWLDKEDGPAIIEIYKGSSIEKENLIYTCNSTNVSDGLMAYKENQIQDFPHTLKEQLFFEKGDIFWVVYHVPSGNLYPLGVRPEASPEFSGNCLMSFNQGETWQTMEAAVNDPGYVWAVKAYSKQEKLETYITLTPNQGEVAALGQNEVVVDYDASKMVNGTYKSNVVVMSNDSEAPFYKIPITLDVSGHKPVISSQNIVEYGNIFHGLSKTIQVELVNNGYGRFKGSSLVSSNPSVFEINDTYFDIPARSKGVIDVTYIPDGTGNDNGVITLTGYKGDVYEFNVFGVGAAPASMEYYPNVLTYSDVDINGVEELKDTVTITNTGEYPLQFGFTNFADDLSHIDWIGTNVQVQKYGYAMGSYDYPVGYVFNDISETGVDVTHEFKNDGLNEFVEVDLGFDFPYFGEKLRQLYITKRSMLTLGTDGKFNATMSYRDKYNPDGYMCAFASELSIATQGKITYKKGLGSFTVQYTDVNSISSQDGVEYTYQIVLYDNGDIKFIYDKLQGLNPDSYKNVYAAVENRAKDDGVFLQSRFQPGETHVGEKRIIYIQSPGSNLIKDVTEGKGIILPGKSQDVVFTVNREQLVEGSHREMVSVLSNDPFNRGKFIEVQIEANQGGVAGLELSNELVQLGSVFQNKVENGVVQLLNTGSKPLTITTINSENGQIVYNGDNDVEVKPGQTMYIEYSVATDVIAAISDKLLINDSEGNVYTVNFAGNIIEGPNVSVSVNEFNVLLNPGEVKTEALTIENTGQAQLDYAIIGTSLVYPVDNEVSATSTEIEEFTYAYKTTYDDHPATYNWIDVGAESKVPFFTDGVSEYWYQIDLPFEFEFYQQKYSKLWVGLQGAVSFDEPEQKMHFIKYSEKMGVLDNVNNCIAPYFSPTTYQRWEDQPERSGVFYKQYDDKFVIEWREFFAPASIPFDYQIIIFNDGRFKIQYRSPFTHDALKAMYGNVGIENHDATEFVQVSYYQKFAGKDVAVEFYPAKKEILAAGASKTYDIAFNAKERYAGDFNEYLTISNNSALNSVLDIPANISISGEAEVTLSEVLDFGEVILSPEKNTYYKEFYIENSGTRRMNIRNVGLLNDNDIVLQARVVDRGRYLWVDLPNGYFSNNFDIDPGSEFGPFRLVLTPETPSFVDAGYSNKLVMTTDFGTGSAEMPISVEYKLPPVFTIDKNEISHIVFDNTVINDKITIGNVEGQSELDYSMSLDYNRTSVANTLIEPMFATGELTVEKKSLNTDAYYGAKAQNDYNRVLAYEEAEAANNAIGVGGAYALTVATAFTAPEDGFKLSNVQTWYVPDEHLNSDIKVEIRVGTSLESSTIQYSEVFNHTVEEADIVGSLLDFELSEPILFMPYEKFFLVFTYPIEIQMPQGVTTVENKPNTYFIYYMEKWFDVQEIASLANVGLLVRAAEKEAENVNWLELSEIEGSLMAGAQKDILLTFYPERAKRPNNNVTLTFNTDDPQNKQEDVLVSLRKNQGPEIFADEDYSLYEGETIDISFKVEDVEGNGVKSVTMPEYENTSFSFANDSVFFSYSPTYMDAGIQKFEVYTEDDLNTKSTRVFYVEVLNVPHGPIVVDDSHIIIDIDNPQYQSKFNDIFMDPDGQDMSFKAEIIGDKEVAELFMSVGGFIVHPKKTGFSKIELTAIDTDGAKTVTTKNIVVNSFLSEEEFLATQWEIYPNPVINDMVISLNEIEEEGEVRVNIYDLSGTVVKSFTYDVENNKISVPVSKLSSGVYMVELVGNNGRSMNKMIKN
ncbi:MAG: S8 family serine peptidase [Bacteroidota bacterium]